jgi:hypothetical protein
MRDVERELRELFEKKSGSVGGVAPRLPETVRNRGRRRQAGTAVIGAFTVAAVVLVSFAGLRAIDRGGADDRVPANDPWAGYEIFERTATIENFTITSPSDWYLVNQWPLGASLATSAGSDSSGSCELSLAPGEETTGDHICVDGTSTPAPVESVPLVPILHLASDDPGLGFSPCASGGFSPAGDDAVLEIAVDSAAINAREAGQPTTESPAWPVRFDEGATEVGGCGEGHYARFEVGIFPYVAFASFGPDATEEDRRVLFDTFAAMRVTDWAGTAPSSRTPGYVIAGGENAAGPWRLELRPSTRERSSADIDLHVVSSEGPGVHITDVELPDPAQIRQAGGDPTFGLVTKQATGVELRLEEGTPPISATLVPMPPSMGLEIDLFFASNPSDVPATAVAMGLLGSPSPTPTEPATGTDQELEAAMAVHERLETDLRRLWTELARNDELRGEVRAAMRDLQALNIEIGASEPTGEQADLKAELQDLIDRFTDSMADGLVAAETLRREIEALRETQEELIREVDPALFPQTVTVTCTGDGEGGTLLSGPAVVEQDDGVHIDVVNEMSSERVFLDLGTGEAPIEVQGGVQVQLVVDVTAPETLQIVCTYEAPPRSWSRPAHHLTVVESVAESS